MTKRLRSQFVSVGIGIGMVLIFAACDGGSDPSEPAATGSTPVASGSGSVASSPDAAAGEIDGLFEVEDGRSLFLRCTGEGSPTVILEGGDGDTTGSYGFAESTLAAETRTCVYDRANLGMSDPAPGPRGFDDLVGDLESLLQQAGVEPPYVLVGTSGGGYITAGYAYRHADDIAGMVFIDTGAPFATRRLRSSRRRPGTIHRTSSSGTTYRSRRTPGTHERRSVTSRYPSSP